MERILTYIIPPEESGMKIKQILKVRHFSAQSLIRLKSEPDTVLLNDIPAFMNAKANAGDNLRIIIRETASSEKIEPVNLPLDIIYEDDDLIVLNKPAGMPIHPSMNNYDNSLANALAWYFAEKKIPFVFRCINRLDRDTSGLTIVAKHYVSAGILSEMVASKAEENGIHREYLAITKGQITPPVGTITAPLGRKEGSVIERTVDYEKGESAITHYTLLKYENGHSLVSLRLETGRTHQIRIHMKYLGFPLIGDYLYNPDMELIQRQALHSYRLSFTHPISGQPMEFVCPLPGDMSKILSLD